VDPARVGERVVINPLLWDGTCEFCKAGEESLCTRVRILGEHAPGTCCQYRSVPDRNAIPVPADVPFETAAAACLVYQTAWRMAKRARVGRGDDVLVFGASGGVGSACVDIARYLGARVFACASGAEKGKRSADLGAATVIDYTREDVRDRVRALTNKRGVDVVMDQVGAETYSTAIRSLRRGGRYVTCGATTGNGPPAELHYIFWNQLEVIGSTMANVRETAEVLRLVFQGRLRPAIAGILPLEEIAEAHRRIEERDHFGKILLAIP
jgi:NADPH:quinone reductase-like Zn-dependent oxidoreductase